MEGIPPWRQREAVKRTAKNFGGPSTCITPMTAASLAFLAAFVVFVGLGLDFDAFLILPFYIPLLLLVNVLFLRRRRARHRRLVGGGDLESIMLRARERVGAEVQPEFWLSDDEGLLFISESNFVFSAFLVSQKAIERLVEKPEAAEAILADELISMQSRRGLRSLVEGGAHFAGMIALYTILDFLLNGAQLPETLPAQILFLSAALLMLVVAVPYAKRGPRKNAFEEYETSKAEAERTVFGVTSLGSLFGPGLKTLRGSKEREGSATVPFPSTPSISGDGSFWGVGVLEPDDQSRGLEETLRAIPKYASVRVIRRKSWLDDSAIDLMVHDTDSRMWFPIPHTTTECLKSGPDLLAYAVYSIELTKATRMQSRAFLRFMGASLFAALLLSVVVTIVLKLDLFFTVLAIGATLMATLLLSLIPLSSRQGRAQSRAELDVQAQYPRLVYALEALVKYEQQLLGYSPHEGALRNLRTSGRKSLQASADY